MVGCLMGELYPNSGILSCSPFKDQTWDNRHDAKKILHPLRYKPFW